MCVWGGGCVCVGGGGGSGLLTPILYCNIFHRRTRENMIDFVFFIPVPMLILYSRSVQGLTLTGVGRSLKRGEDVYKG